MSWSLILGFIAMMGVMITSIEGSWSMYLQPHSIIIVLGGTFALLFYSIPSSVRRNIFLGLRLLTLNSSNKYLSHYREDIIQLTKSKNLGKKSNHPLINYSVQLWEQGIDQELFVVLLSQKRNDTIAEMNEAVFSLKNLAKYPPALGMMGTVIGMIALFSNLDTQQGEIGKNLALAMTATFFGLFLANGIISPLADRLHVWQVGHKRLSTNIYELLLLINENEPAELVEEEVDHRAA